MNKKLTCKDQTCNSRLRKLKTRHCPDRQGQCECGHEFRIEYYECPKCKRIFELRYCTLIKEPTAEQLQNAMVEVIGNIRTPGKKELKTLFKKYPPQFDKAKKPKT
ncbi:MAG: hypothetical protein NTX82_04215 [Candidatus Parcubacteria bacterium]|nr:hypothetical protein [Candidatus Parcubacteria bacterium]